MAIFNIQVNPKKFFVENIFTSSTECASVYEYQVIAENGENLTINLTGDETSGLYILNGVETSFTGSTSIVFNNSLIIRFVLENSSQSGYYNSSTLTVTNNDVVDSENTYTFTVVRQNDDKTCDEGISSGIDSYISDIVLNGNTLEFTGVENAFTGNILLNSYTDEQAQDAVGSILLDSEFIDLTYIDSTPYITATIIAGSITENELNVSVNNSLDLANSSLQSGDNISNLINDAGYITSFTDTNDIDYISNVTLNTNNLTFTGIGNAFNSSVDLSQYESLIVAGNNGEIQFNDSGNLGANSNLFWNNINNRLGIGNNTPTTELDVTGTTNSTEYSTTAGYFVDETTSATLTKIGATTKALEISAKDSTIYLDTDFLTINNNNGSTGLSIISGTTELFGIDEIGLKGSPVKIYASLGPIIDVTSNTTVGGNDVNNNIIINNSSATTLTLEDIGDNISIGARFWIMNRGTGTCTISPNVGITVNTDLANLQLTQYQHRTLIKVASNEWILTY